jgi:hypothetical protein
MCSLALRARVTRSPSPSKYLIQIINPIAVQDKTADLEHRHVSVNTVRKEKHEVNATVDRLRDELQIRTAGHKLQCNKFNE